MTRHENMTRGTGAGLRAAALAAAAVAFLALTCGAQTGKPDFTGHWILDKDQSKLANADDITGITLDIKHAEPKIGVKRRIELTGGSGRNAFVVMTDGKWISDAEIEKDEEPAPAEGQGFVGYVGSSESKTRALWDGAKLVVNSVTKLAEDGSVIEKDSVYSLSADGKTLAIESVRRGGPQGEVKQTEIYRKQ